MSDGGVPRGLHASERDQELDEELAPTFFADVESDVERPAVDDMTVAAEIANEL